MSWRHLLRLWAAGIPIALAMLAGYIATAADAIGYAYAALCMGMAAASLHYVLYGHRHDSTPTTRKRNTR